MKYTTGTVVALAGISNAMPHYRARQLPALSLPSFSLPTGLAGSGGLGSGLFGGGNVPSLPAATGGAGSGFDLGGLLGGLGLGLGGSTPKSTATQTATVTATPAAEAGSSSEGTEFTSSACTPQAAGSGATQNGVVDKNCCADMTVIFARGTSEPGNMGIIAGPPMITALRSKLGDNRVLAQGVDYPASVEGNLNQGADGGKTMASLVSAALSQCPNTKVIVSGYSQGAMVVHNAFQNGVTSSKVAGAVLFGDPLKSQAVGDMPANKVKEFCGTSDIICGGGGDGGATGGHTDYGNSAGAAATFAIQAAGLA